MQAQKLKNTHFSKAPGIQPQRRALQVTVEEI
jgi:hypothetical protein